MKSPLDSPDGDWWNEKVNRRESIWLGVSGLWAATLFGWMAGWTQFGEQNQTGETVEISPDRYQQKVTAYQKAAERNEKGLIPPNDDVFIGAQRYAFDGLPAVLETGREYVFHLGSYDVQHGFSVRQEDKLSKQLSLQILPGYEWRVPMQFDEPGTYHVVCNEFCGQGHRTMHASFVVQDEPPTPSASEKQKGPYDGWLGDVSNFDEPVDKTGSSSVSVRVGAAGNGGNFAFDPPAVKVSQGTTIRWEWTGKGGGHNVVAEAGTFDSGDPVGEAGTTFEHSFEETGVYKYACRPHEGVGMKGVVEVQ